MVATAKAARERGVHSMVGFNYRRVPALALAQRHIAEGRLGDVRQVRVSYLQDWLADEAAPMTWRLRRELAGSGALGDLASHAVDQVRFLLGQEVTAVNAMTAHLRPAAHRRRRTRGGHRRRRCVGHPAHRRRCRGQPRGHPHGDRPQERPRHRGLRQQRRPALRPRVAQPPRRLPRRRRQLHARSSSPSSDDPYIDGWWPPGHVLGWDATFTNQAADFLAALAAGREPTPVVRGRDRRPARARRDRGQLRTRWQLRRGRRGSDLMGRPFTLFTGQWVDLPLEEVARLAAEWGYDGLEVAVSGEHLDAWRWDDDDYVAERLGILEKHGLAAARHLQPPHRPGDLRRPDRLPAPGHRPRPRVGRRRPGGRAHSAPPRR